jgi:hypothetical protein
VAGLPILSFMGMILDAMDLLRNKNVAQYFYGQIGVFQQERRIAAAEVCARPANIGLCLGL